MSVYFSYLQEIMKIWLEDFRQVNPPVGKYIMKCALSKIALTIHNTKDLQHNSIQSVGVSFIFFNRNNAGLLT